MTLYEHKLKNAYIGEVYEYSYDFRNKVASQVTADWYVTAAWTPAYNSNWFTSSNSSVARINKNIESLANATKITLSFTVVLGSSATWTWIRLMWASRTYWTWVLFDVNSNLCQYFIGWDKVTDSSWLSSWTHTTTVVLNLTNKTAVFSRTWKTDYSTSITDTQISNIKNNITLSEIYAWMSAWVISNWYILVE